MNNNLNRTLSLRDLVIYGLCMISPLCLYLVYGAVAQASYGMVPLVYVIGTLLMLFTAFSYVQYSKEVPSAGSIYSYISKGINPHVGFVSGWLILGYYIAVPGLTFALSSAWIGTLIPEVHPIIWVLILTLLNTYVNVKGLKIGVKVNMLLLGLQLFSLVAFFVLGIKFVFIDGHGTGGFSFAPLFQGEHFSFGFIATSVSIAVVGFLGLDGLSTLSEEAKNPKRNIGLAMVCTLLFIGFVYIAQGFLTGLIHPNYSNLDPDMGLFEISKEIGGTTFFAWVIIVNVLAFGVACASGLQSSLSRILYTMSRDKLLPGFFNKIHSKYQTPVNATLFSGFVALIVGSFVPVTVILMFINFGAISAYAMLNLSVMIYFFFKLKRRGLNAIFSYLVYPLIGLFVCGFAWSGFDKTTYIVGLCWTVIGILIGAIGSKGYKITPKIEDL